MKTFLIDEELRDKLVYFCLHTMRPDYAGELSDLPEAQPNQLASQAVSREAIEGLRISSDGKMGTEDLEGYRRGYNHALSDVLDEFNPTAQPASPPIPTVEEIETAMANAWAKETGWTADGMETTLRDVMAEAVHQMLTARLKGAPHE